MPSRSKVVSLPQDVKDWLDKYLVDSNFSGYEALSEALAEKGYQISKSSLHRYGSNFEKSLEAIKLSTEMAKAVVEACPDDENQFGEALTRLVQQKSFEVLTKMEISPEDVKLADLGRMVASVNRSAVETKKYAAEVRQKIEKKFAEMETKKSNGKAIFDAKTLQKVREEIYGIIP